MYINVHYDRKKNKVYTLEQVDGKDVHQEYKPEYFFYVKDNDGKHTSIHGDKATRMEFSSYEKFSSAIRKYENQQTYESRVKPLFKTLERYYKNIRSVNLRKTYFDIETDFERGETGRGYAPPDDPFNRITAITFYNDWQGTLYSLSLPPEHMSLDQAEKELDGIENNLVCETEEQMLELYFELTKDAHVFASWNGNTFDIPYLVNRTKYILGISATKNFCLWGYTPVSRTIEKYGKETQVYDLIGKVHLDMMELYQKYTYTEQASYSLDNIALIELGEQKVPYDGSLDKLYNEDYRKFVEYARQDTALLHKLDLKKDHINLAFSIAHENRVDLKTVMGSVALSDNAITLEAHRRNMIVPDKKDDGDDNKIAGAWVADPKTGITQWIGSVDLTSLYPSIFRALNLGNETIVGQVKHTLTEPLIKSRMAKQIKDDFGNMVKKKEEKFAAAWGDLFWVLEFDEIMNKTDTILELKLAEDGEIFKLSGKEIYDFVFENGYIITANATIIRTDKQSVIASLLEKWFNERKIYQKRADTYQKLTAGIELPQRILDELDKK